MSHPVGSVSISVDLDASDLSTAMSKAVTGAMTDALSSVRSGMSAIQSEIGRVDGSSFGPEGGILAWSGTLYAQI